MAKRKLMFNHDSRPDFNLVFSPLIAELNKLSFVAEEVAEAVTTALESYRQSIIMLYDDGVDKLNLPLMLIIHNTTDYFSIHRGFRKYFTDNGLSYTTLQSLLDIRKKIADKAKNLLKSTPTIVDMNDVLVFLEEISPNDLVFMLDPPEKKMREELVVHIQAFVGFKYVQTVDDVRVILDIIDENVRPVMLSAGLEVRFFELIDYMPADELQVFAQEKSAFKIYLSADVYERMSHFIANKIKRFKAHDLSLNHIGAEKNFLNDCDEFNTFISENPPALIEHIINTSIKHAASRGLNGSEASRRSVAAYRQSLYALFDSEGIISQYIHSQPMFELVSSNKRLVGLLALTDSVMRGGETSAIYFTNSMSIFNYLCKIIQFDYSNLEDIVQIYHLARYHHLRMIQTALEQAVTYRARNIKNQFTQFLLLMRLAEHDIDCLTSSSATSKNKLFESVKSAMTSDIERCKAQDFELMAVEQQRCIFELYTNEASPFKKHLMLALIELLNIPKPCWVPGAEVEIHPAGGILSYYNHCRRIETSQVEDSSEPAHKRPRI